MIPATFENFKQRQLQRGIETHSESSYKGYKITLRAYSMSGITYKIFKVTESGKFIKLKEEGWNFYIPAELLQRAKTYIDNYEDNLIKKYDKIIASKDSSQSS